MIHKLILRLAILLMVTFIFSKFIYTSSPNTPENNPSAYYQVGGTNWTAPSYADKLKNPLAEDSKATKDAKSVYTTNCESCHGTKGEGNGPAAVSIVPRPKNLASETVQKQSDGVIFWKITTGKSPMVSWKDVLTEKQRWGLVNYIRQLKKK
jgi:mono/diheme cytochrome c family protein